MKSKALCEGLKLNSLLEGMKFKAQQAEIQGSAKHRKPPKAYWDELKFKTHQVGLELKPN